MNERSDGRGRRSRQEGPPVKETQNPTRPISRRTTLKAVAGVAASAGALATAGRANAQADGPDFGSWFEKTENFDGVVDETGQSEVTVAVGAPDVAGGPLAFEPAAIRVDPGTTIRWEWTGSGGPHNVVATDGSFDSGDPVPTAETTFDHTFESEGVSRYLCEPHETAGMKGAVVVGTPGSGGGGDGGSGDGSGQDGQAADGSEPLSGPWDVVMTGLVMLMMAAPIVYHYNRDRVRQRASSVVPTVTEAPQTDDEQVETLGHDEFDPTGTLSLVLVYLAILGVMWVFMYFVEFLGGPTVVG